MSRVVSLWLLLVCPTPVSYLISNWPLLITSYVAVNHSCWHRRRVTVRRKVFWLFVFNFSLTLAMKWVFIGKVEPQQPLICAIQISHAATLQSTALVFLIVCIVFIVLDYVKTLQLLPAASRRAVPKRVETIIELNDMKNPAVISSPTRLVCLSQFFLKAGYSMIRNISSNIIRAFAII